MTGFPYELPFELEAGPIDYGYNQIEIGTEAYSTEADIRRVLEGIVELGAPRVRIMVPWDMVQKAPGTVPEANWFGHDRALNLCEEYGLAPLLFVSVGPNWLGLPNMPSFDSAANYGDFCRQLAQRYGPAGRGQCDAFEIWNEANSVGFSPWQRSPETYAKYLRSSYDGIKSVHPTSTVVSVGTMAVGTEPYFRLTTDPLDYIKGFYAAGAGDSCDAIGYHWYNNGPAFEDNPPGPEAIYWLRLLELREFLVAQGHSDKKVWLTEIGVPHPTFSLETCRDRLKIMVDQIISESWLGPFFIYGLRNTGRDLGNHINQYGMVDFDFVKKQPLWDYAASIRTTDPGDITPPTDPADLVASGPDTGSTISTIGLSWTASTDDTAVTGYRIYRDGVRIESAWPSTSYTDTGRTANTEHAYYVTAIDARLNESGPSLTTLGKTAMPTPGTQALYEYDFTGTGTFKPTTLFTDFGLGYNVSGSIVNHNTASSAGYKYSGGIYNFDQASPDHFAEVVWAANTNSGDRSNMAIVRSDAAGDNFVYAVGHWSTWSSTFWICTRIAGVMTGRRSFGGTGLSNGDRLRLTADDNVYTLTVIRANGLIEDPRVWVDEASVFPGASNLRTGFGFQHIRSGGVNWNAPGIKGLWRGHDLRPVVNETVNAPAMTMTASMPAPEILLENVYPPAMAMNAAMPTPSVSVDVTVRPPVMAMNAAMPTPVVGVGTFAEVDAPAMTMTASMHAPSLSSGVTVSPPAMGMVGSMPTPVVTVENPPAIARDRWSDGDRITSAFSSGLSWSHIGTSSGSNIVALVGLVVSNTGITSYTGRTRTATYGGTPMTSLGARDIGSSSSQGFVELFALLDPPTGTQTVDVDVSSTTGLTSMMGTSVTYTGVGDVVASTSAGNGGISGSEDQQNYPITSDTEDSWGVVAGGSASTYAEAEPGLLYLDGGAVDGNGDRMILVDLQLDTDAGSYWQGTFTFDVNGTASAVRWAFVSAALIPA